MVTILIAGGGTGGHVFPMLAVGQALKASDPETRVVYAGTERGIEARVLPAEGEQLELLDIRPLRGGGARGFARGVACAAASIPVGRNLVRRLSPGAVLSVGGYAGGPVALAARTLGVPVAILEPNSVLGLSNRLLAPFAARAYTAFAEAERFLRPSIVMRSGVPLRKSFAKAPYAPGGDERTALLVLGGSQGAKALNEVVPRAIASLTSSSIDVVHQVGKEHEAPARALYTELGLADRVTVVPFISDMAAALARADIVIARAGASTLAELCAVGRPAILIPYPFAADDHQMHNARSLERAGAAVAIAQADATAARIAGEIGRLLQSPELRMRMAAAAASLGKPDAAARVAEDLRLFARRDAASRRRGAA